MYTENLVLIIFKKNLKHSNLSSGKKKSYLNKFY